MPLITTLAELTGSDTIPERFAVHTQPLDDHLIWTGYATPREEPRVSHKGRSKPAIKAIALDLGITARLTHICDNPLCVSLHHWGTRAPSIDILALLHEHEPMPELGPTLAAEEIGVPLIPAHIWQEYLNHDHG